MSVKLGMNGFGRIGRYLLRLLADSEDIVVAAVNARADNAQLAHLFPDGLILGGAPADVGGGKSHASSSQSFIKRRMPASSSSSVQM